MWSPDMSIIPSGRFLRFVSISHQLFGKLLSRCCCFKCHIVNLKRGQKFHVQIICDVTSKCLNAQLVPLAANVHPASCPVMKSSCGFNTLGVFAWSNTFSRFTYVVIVSVKIGGQYFHRSPSLHFVVLAFYDAGNNYVHTRLPLKRH